MNESTEPVILDYTWSIDLVVQTSTKNLNYTYFS